MQKPFFKASIAVLTLTAACLAQAGETTHLARPLAGLGCQASTFKSIPQPSGRQLAAAGLDDVPLAANSARRDLVAAPFSQSTAVHNPLFPISSLRSAILNGTVDGKVFHTETTLLPRQELIEWTAGQCVRVLVSQYMAFLDGRLQETAIDLYAQSDDGSVWYLGESVFDYDEDGFVTTTEGTWHAGNEGPAAMIMPARPRIGDAYRPENIPGNVFEELTVTAVNETYDGPSGPVNGVMVGSETHQDGSMSEKVFAPGYGEFLSMKGSNVEAMALAVPIDFVAGGVPEELSDLASAADSIFNSPLLTDNEWALATRLAADIQEDWQELRAGQLPPRLVEPTDVAISGLTAQIVARNRGEAHAASIAAAYAINDLKLRYRPAVKIDAMRFELWARRALLDAQAGKLGHVRSDFVTLEWLRDRIAHVLKPVARTRLDTLVRDLGTAVGDEDLESAAGIARELRKVVKASL